jgi:hypothetical protein
MVSLKDVNKVLDAIDLADPEGDDAELQAMRNALLWVSGVDESADDFVHYYVTER